ncbi:hypothetical protein K5_027 [Pseudomonas phage K5]|uniref:Uncharacterized protein n=3 Tax=Pakpunavirus TaxID=1921407 RepID=A0AAE8YJW9_9CAUD|nr:membrane protein [Pseudomonas phage C11]YP_009199964.1 membrane protein [Pseudomonas phage K8]YP_009273782.1 membrane protein [Pseudomonas phage K5]YP_010762698.1 hypothetical protein QE326_gp023 [Pseudomonas phage PaZq-1]YP_010765086.1 hypothetical protein QE346_gp024 [Pseudomonas phage phipa10]YP_010765263.1 hypothetical protein QE347_gp155 [Pseudomonas phage vB_Paer_Ps12]MBO6558732.1 hypothetical protein [Pseudomonadales bacterium]QAY01594.1 hypothetical protein PaSzw1_28 [Pseudomonas 
MKIDKNSWHMWLHRTFETPVYSAISSGWHSVTLCSYFWQTVFLVVWLASTVVALAAVVGSVLYSLALGPLTGYVLGGTLAVMGFVWIGIIAVFYGVWVFYRFSRFMSSKSSSKDGILVSYLKAKKAKFCPIVELK